MLRPLFLKCNLFHGVSTLNGGQGDSCYYSSVNAITKYGQCNV